MALKVITLPHHGKVVLDPETLVALWKDEKITVQSNYYWRFIQISTVHGIVASLAYNASKTERLEEDYRTLINALGL
ncbi:MAG: hypothetical protein WB699_05445 [Bacteroidota bacterium]